MIATWCKTKYNSGCRPDVVNTNYCSKVASYSDRQRIIMTRTIMIGSTVEYPTRPHLVKEEHI